MNSLLKASLSFLLLSYAIGIASNVIDYNSQVGNKPKFTNGLITVHQPGAPPEVHVNYVNMLKVATVPVIDADNPLRIVGASCQWQRGYRDATGEIKWTMLYGGTDEQSTHMLQTPDAIYVCQPDGTGKGFRYMRYSGTPVP